MNYSMSSRRDRVGGRKNFFHMADFKYPIPRMFLESFTYSNDHSIADLLVFITWLIQSLDPRIFLEGEPSYVEEKPMLVTLSGVKRIWTPDLIYGLRVEDAIISYPLQVDSFN